MKSVVSLPLAAALVLSGGLAAFASPQKDANVPASYGEQIEVQASKVLSPKERAERGLSADSLVTVTKAPRGPVDTSRS